MDGNRRAGEADFGDKLRGHAEGVERAEEIVRTAGERGIKCVTLYAFSTENWKRSQEEVDTLFSLFRTSFSSHLERLMADGVCVRFIGRRDRLPEDMLDMMSSLEERSKDNQELTLNVALDYGGRDELVRATERLLASGTDVSESALAAALDTAGIPDPDLIIRTGGEHRLSGFLLWQSSYAELYFTDTYWPHFTQIEFDKALDWYATRERRMGK